MDVRRVSRGLAMVGVLSGAACIAATLPVAGLAQAAPAAARVMGTVKSINGNAISVAPDGGAAASAVTVPDGARVQQSADMKTVSAATLDQLAVGDRVLVVGTPGEGGAFTASRLIMIKSSAIAQRNAASEADWAKRGSGGIVKSVDPSTNAIAISSGKRGVKVTVTGSTIFRRYAPGSVKFEDAQPSTLTAIQSGDQLRVRGDKSPDGMNITADEIVSGTFRNLSGTIVSLNAAGNSLVLKDLASKKNVTVAVSSESDLRSLPPAMAARFGNGAAGQHREPGSTAPSGEGHASTAGEAHPAAEGDGAATGRRPGGRGGDLANLIPRLPKTTLAELKPGEALMIVASGNDTAGSVTAITLLSGVEALLTGPAGSGMSLSPWSLGSGGNEGAGGASE